MAAVVLCSPVLFGVARAEDQKNPAAEFQARFERETDAVHRAKLMQRLGPEEFEQIEKDVSQGDVAAAARIVTQYRDQVRSCIEALDARKINAARHDSGFKQLQISVQEALRRLDEILAGLTADQQPDFAAARSELQKINDHLVQELFPGSPSPGAPAAKSGR